ncbi:MAG: regulatory protein RecX [Alistipes sp.]|jgi:regulatory protein|nr:RecX family transcriptional regulator [Alistipes sp.]MBQ5353897.1 RecX family transcriptional regulator [Alistipes sp.]MBQ6583860.1 RecX family transcriptional regulator [Alistipes sp.]MBR2115500.1 RecX family transcriptional regulator [Alistipes sp.]MEE0916400.1 regulatory protein RecX [Alistipes sp.]
MVQKEVKRKSAEQALRLLMNMAARAERSSGDALRLMKRWGVDDNDAQRVLQRLIAERFIDDSRYAAAFVREKINLSGWGSYKIVAALRRKGVDNRIIENALSQYGSVDMEERLQGLLEKKIKTVKYRDTSDLRAKLFRFAASRGYDYSTAMQAVDRVVKGERECDNLDF